MFASIQLCSMPRILQAALLTTSLTVQSLNTHASDDHDHAEIPSSHTHEMNTHKHAPGNHDETNHDANHHQQKHTEDDHDDEHHEASHEEDNHDTQHQHQDSDHGHDDDHEEGHAESVAIDDATAKRSNIITALAQSGEIAQTQRVYGKAINDASQISHLGARFDGTIIEVNVSVGDKVKKGTTLARVESSQSLTPYQIKAPFTGIITARHANPGELVQNDQPQPLFTLFNDDILWGEFKIFPNQMLLIKSGQDVIMENERFNIAHIIPNSNDMPYELARVRLDNHEHGWRAGVTLKADVITQTKRVNVRIPNQALQQVEGKTVVFIKHGNEYTASPVVLGLQDPQFSEVLSGLTSSDEYVIENSYLIKADFEKAGAEHSH